jgi:hypothetical protein
MVTELYIRGGFCERFVRTITDIGRKHMIIIDINTETNAVDVLKGLPTQVMLFDRISLDNGISWNTALFIKDRSTTIGGFGEQPNISIRAGRYTVDGVDIVNVLVKINKDTYYESFLNYYHDDRLNAFEDLSVQKKIPVFFLDEKTNIVKSTVTNNQIRNVIKGYSIIISNSVPWTDNQFDEGKAEFFVKFPDLLQLWNKYANNK